MKELAPSSPPTRRAADRWLNTLIGPLGQFTINHRNFMHFTDIDRLYKLPNLREAGVGSFKQNN